MRWAWVAVSAVVILTGCGSVGNTMPPALHIPQRVIDFSAAEQGDKILVQFTLPTRTTENMLIQKEVTAELGIGPASAPLNLDAWALSAQRFTDIPTDAPIVKYAVPAAPWVGKDVVVAVRMQNERGRAAGWSNPIVLSVVPPLAQPVGLKPEDVAEGVRLTWLGGGPTYRVYRRVDDDANTIAVGESDQPAFTDKTTEYQKTYHYSVEAFRSGGDVHAVSERTAEVEIAPKDTWPPPVPAGLAAIASPGRVELAWERSGAPDLAGYNVYRAEGEGSFQKIGETREGPSYSDTTAAAGKTYRYAVSAFDQIPNESDKSAPVSVVAQ